MLLEFTCSNYKSIYKKKKLSMLASSDDTREEELVIFDKYRINRISAIYGPNGSGKTNLLEAIIFVCQLVSNSMKYEPGDLIKCSTHKLAKEDEPSEFTFQYVVNGIRYAYGFSVMAGEIEEEYLFYFPNKRQTKVFYRKGMDVEFGDSFRKISNLAMEALKKNRLFLACAANYTSNTDIENAFLFFKRDMKGFRSGEQSEHFVSSAIEFMSKHPELKETYLRIVAYLNTGIRDFEVSYEKKKFKADELPEGMPTSLTELLMKSESVKSEAIIHYDLFSTDLRSEESTGIKKLFAFLYPYLDTLTNGRVLLCDEIETGLHESVVMGILRLFTQLYPEKKAQLIFTTHDTSLLDSELFRRDQVWLTELDSSRSTDLYSIAEIKNVRKTENLKNGYVNGKYGAIPMLNAKMMRSIVEEINVAPVTVENGNTEA